ncbi:MAG TPA: sulfatase/phosphatase domain-containing protein, partial [Steroidobacteraceae bacterium]|nr:sulfatase/phosphatase domain-containing protein [Steroidobacteraceae bacterium]
SMEPHLEEIGGPRMHAHYPAGFAWAMDTPFQWMKQVASHLGGTRNPMVISWPARIHDPGTLRSQFSFVTDLYPTILEAAGIAPPGIVNGVAQQPLDGTSLLYTFDDAKAATHHRTQYFQLYGNRAIYHDGWMASAFRGRAPWDFLTPLKHGPIEDVWELYNLDNDYSQAHDLAGDNALKLQELEALFYAEAGRNKALPIVDGGMDTKLPNLSAGRKSFTYYSGTWDIPERQAPPFVMRSFTVTAEVALAPKDTGGVIAADGGVGGGWSLWVNAARRPVFTYNYFGVALTEIVGRSALTTGHSTLTLALDYSKPMSGGEATAVLAVNGAEAGRVRIPKTAPYLFSLDETFDIGIDGGTAVGIYAPGVPFAGTIERVQVDMR